MAPSHRSSRALPLLALSALLACAPPPPRPLPVDPAPVPAPSEARPSLPPAPAAHHIRFEHAPDGELEPLVQAFVHRARAEGRVPLVYVGATWCEPCQYFHAAAERGDLDAELPSLAMLELDLDHDRDRIAAAGYGSRMVPLFAVPGEDGRGSGRQIEGSIHGPGSPREIAPRLRELLAGP